MENQLPTGNGAAITEVSSSAHGSEAPLTDCNDPAACPVLPLASMPSPKDGPGSLALASGSPPVAALYVRADSIYKEMGLDCWDAERDARNWPGGMPCVAHPPCRAWGVLSHMASPRPGEHHLARIAVWQIRENGGVLEHPKGSKLWKDQSLPEPGERDRWGGWTMIIPQRWWGHPMMKETRLYIVGCEPKDAPEIPYTMEPATHAMGGKWLPDVKKRLGRDGVIREDARAGKVREGTPPMFAVWLVELASKCSLANTQAERAAGSALADGSASPTPP